MYKRVDEMKIEREKFFDEKVNAVKINYSFSENAKNNF